MAFSDGLPPIPGDQQDSRAEVDVFRLSPEHHDAFIAILDEPPLPGPKLRALMRRLPAWASSETCSEAEG